MRRETVPADQQSVACLSDAEIGELAATARRVEQHYGAPQDIEWAIAEEVGHRGPRVFLLQSRPETVWSQREATPLAAPRARAFDHVISVLGGRKT